MYIEDKCYSTIFLVDSSKNPILLADCLKSFMKQVLQNQNDLIYYELIIHSL